MNLPTVTAGEARHLLLDCQGLLDDPTRRVDAHAIGNLIERMGFVQLDTINVVDRAHHLTLASRADGYAHAMLDALQGQQRMIFEHWTHDASLIPTRWFAHCKHRFKRYQASSWHKQRLGADATRVIRQVLKRITADGPLLSRDFQQPDRIARNGWWDWKPHKAALEHLWRAGRLYVIGRVNFHKVYDLTERAVPQHHALPMTSRDELIDFACRTALERLGLATAREISQFWNMVLVADIRPWLERALQRGEIEQVLVQSADASAPVRSFALSGWQKRLRELAEAPDRARLLCPFDPVLRDRARALRLFNFEYRFEAFVPQAKRKFGYYTMPVLERDRLIARVDPKLHRAQSLLEIKRVWWEQGITPTKARRKMLEQAAERLATFTGASRVSIAW